MTEQYYYSYSAKGFFWLSADELKGNDIPADLMPVSEEEHAALFLGQERGKYINHTPDGPVLVDQPDYSPEELIAQAESKKSQLMQMANAEVAPLQDAVDLDIATGDEQALLLKWKKYRVLLNRVNPENAPDIIWPDIPA
ncbi:MULTISPECIES: tail fiber assembly protein [Enterobacter cloacae complex]|uniref:tail fiber assembly protein n=1 Tax=Enterobacter cloacae complex TaxID=354276 RepID=UPI0018C32583|nr:tail fiber assembly protein [Enterobacter roggenkampii]HCT9401803.1 tail fiber assembly protein [Enterobacter hormaechei]MBG0658230.1 tail fiber assembly protein [Enterobacter roggenkampii]MCK6912380.1 tail fiber assembly protein [Enterobacter roggenkampii]MCM7329194.1 tail fiber assembly protein [Enterobacter roggenkampii]MDV0447931.1 tail fiber assembly protein [Enterobacter roggenkampii]